MAEWKDKKTLDQVLDEADRAMYTRKKAAHGQVMQMTGPGATNR